MKRRRRITSRPGRGRRSARLASALAQHRAGRLADAEGVYREILAAHPDDAEAHHLLGVLLHQSGRVPAGLEHYRNAARLEPQREAAWRGLAMAASALGRHAQAAAALAQVVRLRPEDLDARSHLGNALAQLGDHEGAAAQFRAVLERAPQDAQAHCNLGWLLAHAGRFDEAIACYREAIVHAPRFPEAHFNLAHALQRRGFLEDAARHYREVLALAPDLVAARINLATVLQDWGEVEEAVRLYREALRERPGLADVHAGLGLALLNQDRVAQAAAAFDEALRVDPAQTTARWLRPRLLPVLYDSEAEIAEYRCRFREGLERLAREVRLEDSAAIDDAYRGITARTNFLVNYQGRDDRDLQRTYGELVCRILAARYPEWHIPPPTDAPARGERLRVGFASAFLWNHTVGKLFRGWMERLDRSRFDVYCYHLGVQRDEVTQRIEAASTDLYQIVDDAFYTDRSAFERVCKRVRDDRLHVLVYPEIGMDEGTLLLAALRLAPVQCAAWGHPVTPGLPSLDYFLSSELMEPEGGEAHYNERLVRLPNLSICYARPPQARGVDRAGLGLRPGAVVYLSCQSPYKYLPQYDGLFPAIAREVPAAQFVFLRHSVGALTEKLKARLQRAFDAAGLELERFCVFLPRLSQSEYYALNAAGDVFLDTPAWSGGNTTLEAVACGLPVVTWPGPLMRQRHSYAVLRRLGIEETIAASAADYVAIAARLGRDPEWRREISERTRAVSDRVFDDLAAVRALEDFLTQAGRQE